jgi:hypothetical protein
MDGTRSGGREDKLPRPTGGEVPIFVNGVEIPLDRARDDVYGWNDVGGESAVDSNRDERRLMRSDEHSASVFTEDPTVRSAVWSPSGLSDLGR